MISDSKPNPHNRSWQDKDVMKKQPRVVDEGEEEKETEDNDSGDET
jgi:hypothetical protein